MRYMLRVQCALGRGTSIDTVDRCGVEAAWTLRMDLHPQARERHGDTGDPCTTVCSVDETSWLLLSFHGVMGSKGFDLGVEDRTTQPQDEQRWLKRVHHNKRQHGTYFRGHVGRTSVLRGRYRLRTVRTD